MPVMVNSVQAIHNSSQPRFVFASNSKGSLTLSCYELHFFVVLEKRGPSWDWPVFVAFLRVLYKRLKCF